MQNYHDLLQKTMLDGTNQFNTRTGKNCLVLVGQQLQFDLSKGFPAITTKKLAFNNMKGELLGFFRGYDNAADFRALGCGIWDQNANETAAWLSNPNRKGADDLGRIYGKQWTDFKDNRIANSLQERDNLASKGYKQMLFDSEQQKWMMQRSINQLENALRTILTNPSDRRVIVSGWNPAEFDLMALPPCFTPDTMVSTINGYQDISSITEGDFVLSATGIPRKVNQVWKTQYKGNIIRITPRYQKKPIECTPNHPFLVKNKGWVNAINLKETDYIAIPIIKGDNNHSFLYTIKHNTSKQGFIEHRHALTNNDYFFLGYFLGDGWCSTNSNLINVAIATKDVSTILPLIRQTLKVSKKKSASESVATYNTRSTKWIHICREFGYKAHGKKIPHWVFTSSEEARKSFLEGYLSADGSKGPFNEDCATTVSHDLAFGLQMLFATLGRVACVTHQERPAQCLIDGRLVNQRGTYFIQCASKRNNYGTTCDENYIWVGVKRLDVREYSGNVFNLDVETEHTYIVSNIATHNCHMDYRFVAFEDTKTLHVTMTIRSWDLFLGGPFNCAETALFLSIMAKLSGYTPGIVTIQATNAHIYEDHFDQVREQLNREHFDQPQLVLSENIKKIDNLEDVSGAFARIEPADISLTGYQSHAAIKAPMAA